MTAPAAGEPLLEFLAVMRRLRAECPWKREQTHRSLARYLLEETHETLEAIDTGDLEHLREELGDLLLQVYFHAVVAEESGAFTIDDVARGITEKMYRRNPHVFGPPADDGPRDADSVNAAWQAIKDQDTPRASLTDGLPDTLPALLYAAKVLERSERSERSESTDGGPIRLRPGAENNLSDPRRIGERLLGLVAEAVVDGVDPEQALRDAVRRLDDSSAPPSEE